MHQDNFGQGSLPPPAVGQQKQPANVLNMLFVAGVVLSAINCFARADYNLPIFLFAYLAWDTNYGKQRLRIIYLFIYSCVVDLFYVIYWGSSMGAFYDNLDWLNSVYVFTLIMTSVLMVLKVVTSDNLLQEQVSIGGMTQNLSAFFKSGHNHDLAHSNQAGHINNAQHIQYQGQYEQNINPYDSQNLGKNHY